MIVSSVLTTLAYSQRNVSVTDGKECWDEKHFHFVVGTENMMQTAPAGVTHSPTSTKTTVNDNVRLRRLNNNNNNNVNDKRIGKDMVSEKSEKTSPHCTGRAKKSNPLGKIRYLWNCSRFFHQVYSIYAPCRRLFKRYKRTFLPLTSDRISVSENWLN